MDAVAHRAVALIVFVALTVFPVALGHAAPEENDDSPPGNNNCFATWSACRQGCITTDTVSIGPLVIDWDTNMCLNDCNLTLVACIAFTMDEAGLD
jgi:hypothetical protein